MSKSEAMKLIRENKVKTVRELSERGYSTAMIAKCLGIPETNVRFLQRRE